jgi:hypothetical protein
MPDVVPPFDLGTDARLVSQFTAVTQAGVHLKLLG